MHAVVPTLGQALPPEAAELLHPSLPKLAPVRNEQGRHPDARHLLDEALAVAREYREEEIRVFAGIGSVEAETVRRRTAENSS
ncbi:hypothetical protein ACFC6L_17030 [Kitasatospora phosalacinea]|uniref:hypothetical protein n=1 Tax=Kitasatospora phosalacinea TaxID=2065 RepID=UPI0035DEB7CE